MQPYLDAAGIDLQGLLKIRGELWAGPREAQPIPVPRDAPRELRTGEKVLLELGKAQFGNHLIVERPTQDVVVLRERGREPVRLEKGQSLKIGREVPENGRN